MMLEVSKIIPIIFKSNKTSMQKQPNNVLNTQVDLLNNVTNDYGIKTPNNYKLLEIQSLPNGLSLYSYKLSNGYKVSIIPMENSPATVKNYVNVGSMNETDDIKGISHFLEHMAFNGTNGSDNYLKLDQGDSFNKIDELGGWTNASTNYALTDYVNSSPMLDDKDLEQQIKVIAAMTEDLSILSSMVEKEKYPVSSEIDMILDDASTIAADQTLRTLFNIKSSADELVGGSIEHIQNLTKEDVVNYYNKYYTPDNMHLVITGNVDPQNTIEFVSKNFHSKKTSKGKKYEEKLIPIDKTVRKDFIFPKIKSTYTTIGFAAHEPANIKESAISDIIIHYITSTRSGITNELKKIDATLMLGNEKISTNPYAPTYIFFQTISSDDNSEIALKILHDKLNTLEIKNEKELNNIKKTLINNYNDLLEHSLYINSMIGQSEFDKNIDLIINYEDIINSITLDDVNNYIKKHLNTQKAAISVIHPEVSKNNVFERYNDVKSLSFKGRARQPVNEDKIYENTLENNYKIVFSESKNNNVPFIISLKYNLPEDINPAAVVVLNKIYNTGTLKATSEEFNRYLEDNQINLSTTLSSQKMSFNCNTSLNNLGKSIDKVIEILNEPRITEDEFKTAVNSIKNKIALSSVSANSLYNDYNGKNKHTVISRQKILDNIDKLTIGDVKKLHNYIIHNSNGYISTNLPENNKNLKSMIEDEFNKLNVAQKDTIKAIEYNNVNINKPIVIQKVNKKSQADIRQTYEFKLEDSLKERLCANIMNLILSKSNSIGLFNELREKEHLAYSVHSTLNLDKNNGIIALKILTSTESSETGNTTYENVQKSINGFNRQINKLINSEYTDNDLETAKKIAKANLLNNETVLSRITSIDHLINNGYKPNMENELFNLVDSITREDIDNISQKIFVNNYPIYTITASKNTLEYNKDYLNTLSK